MFIRRTRFGAEVQLVQAMLSVVRSPPEGVEPTLCPAVIVPDSVVSDRRWAQHVPVMVGKVDTGGRTYALALTRLGTTALVTVADLGHPAVMAWVRGGFANGLLIAYAADTGVRVVRTCAATLEAALADTEIPLAEPSSLGDEIAAHKVVLGMFDDVERLARLGLKADDVQTLYLSTVRVAESAAEASAFAKMH